MGRSYAKLMTSIWDDPEWRLLEAGPQRLYLMLLSQPGLTFCGVLAYTPRRWAGLVAKMQVRAVLADLDALESRRFLVVDKDTEEVWIRSFVRHDGVLKSPNLVVAAHEDYRSIVSDTIRQRFLEGLPEGFREGFLKPPDDPSPKGSPSRARSAPTSSTASPPAPAAEPHPPGNPPVATNGAESESATNGGGQIPIESQPLTGTLPAKDDPLVERLLSNWPKPGDRSRHLLRARAAVGECLAVVDPKLVDEAIGAMLDRSDRPRSPKLLVNVVREKAAACGVPWPESG